MAGARDPGCWRDLDRSFLPVPMHLVAGAVPGPGRSMARRHADPHARRLPAPARARHARGCEKPATMTSSVPAALAPPASAAFGGAVTTVERLSARLHDGGIRYCHWKSNEHVDASV